jgi:hypothetical protein
MSLHWVGRSLYLGRQSPVNLVADYVRDEEWEIYYWADRKRRKVDMTTLPTTTPEADVRRYVETLVRVVS